MPTKLDINYFIDEVLEEEKENIKNSLTPIVAKRIIKEATRIESSYFKLVADSMNFFSPPHGLLGDGDPFEGVDWKNLKRSTIVTENNYYNKFGTPEGYVKTSNKWFFKGNLQKFLKRARVGSYFGNREIKVNDGLIEYRSNLENERRPFNYKQEVKITGELKSGGTNEELRPLFEPIREFYINKRLPRLLDKAADDAIAWNLNRIPRWRNRI